MAPPAAVELDRPDPALRPSRPGLTRSRVPAVVGIAVATAVAAGVALRFRTESELWLDEALTVNIARLPLSQLPEALRHDGAPPLYYALLHGWAQLFGDGNASARALSGLFGVASLPLMWLAGRRLGGPRVAWAALLLLASSPYAVQYGSEARMYTLVVFLVLAGYLALMATLDRPRPLPVVGLALSSGLLALTHYWSLYLLAATAVALAVRALASRGTPRRHALVAGAALGAGGLLFVPWLPSFVYQLRHTGTPWAPPVGLNAIFDTIGDYAGGFAGEARLLLTLLALLSVLGLLGRALDGHRIELDLRTQPVARGLALVTTLTLLGGVLSALVTGSGFVSRYASVALAPFLLLVALGVGALADRRARYATLAVLVVLGLGGGWRQSGVNRTQAGVNAAALNALGRDGDVVAYCPDQLGPSTSRLLDDRFDQLTFPAATSPRFVDWVDYAQRQAGSNPTAFAEMLDQRAGDGDVWLVWAPDYQTFANYCEIVERDLADMRPEAEVVRVLDPLRYREPAWLLRYPGRCRVPLDRTPAPPATTDGGIPRETVFPQRAAGSCSPGTTTPPGARPTP